MPYLFSALILATFAWLSYKNDRRALALLPALAPLYLIRFEFGGIPTTLLELLVLIALGFWAYSRPWTRPILTKRDIPLLALFASVVLVGTVASDDAVSAVGIAKAYCLEPALLFFAFRDRLAKEDWYFGLRALGVTACALAAFGIFQWATGLGLPIPYDFERRITSVFPYPNAYGLFVTPILVALGIYGYGERKWSAIGVAMALFATLLLSKTEAGMITALAAWGVFAFTAATTIKRRAIIASIGALGVLASLAITPIRQKILLQDTSGLVRRSQWQETASLIKDHPVVGVGLNQYPKALEPYHSALQYEIFQYPHNLILNAWVEAGILSVVFVLTLLTLIVWRMWQHSKNALAAAAAFALLAMFIHGLVDVPFYKNDLAILTAFLLALMLSTTYDKLERAHTGSPHA